MPILTRAKMGPCRALLGLYMTAALVMGGCASTSAEMVESRDVAEAGGTPRIFGVVDLGGGDVTTTGTLRRADERSDIVVVGAALWVHGEDFGRQPSVTVGDRPAAVLGRSSDGGLVTRVPAGTPPGDQRLMVRQERGAAERVVRVRRWILGLLPGGSELVFASLDEEGPGINGSIPVQDGRFLALSAEGRAAYLLSSTGTLTTIELAAAGGAPRVFGHLNLEGAPRALLAATGVPRAVVLRREDALVLDLTSPLRPVRRGPFALPAALRGAATVAALSPDGRWLAMAAGEGDRVALVELDRLGEPGLVPAVQPVLGKDDPILPRLTGLVFTPDGQTLWAAVRPAATTPGQPFVLAFRLHPQGEVPLEAARRISLPEDGGASIPLAASKTPPLASGAAIRLPPEKAAIFLGGDGLYRLDSAASPLALAPAPAGGRMQAVEVSPDGRWALALVQTDRGALSLLSAPADGRPGTTRRIFLGTAPPAVRGEPGILRVQP